MKPKIGSGLAAFVIGIACGAFISVVFIYDTEKYFLLFVAELFLIGALSLLALFLMDTFLVPHINRRRCAIRAFGDNGIKAMRSDKSARLAYKGIYSFLNEDYQQSEKYLQDAIALPNVRHNQAFCVEWLIKVYKQMGDDAKYRWACRKAVELSPDNAEVQARLGHIYFSEGNLTDALSCCEQVQYYDPNNGYSYYIMAQIYLVRGEDEKARETLEKLIRINEDHPLAHAEYAIYYAMQGDSENARVECLKAQVCGIKDPERLNCSVKAILSFNETEADLKNLPPFYYRRRKIEDNQEQQ